VGDSRRGLEWSRDSREDAQPIGVYDPSHSGFPRRLHKQAFGEEPPLMNSVATMTDTDNTKEQATVYYGDIQFAKVEK
jgi:DUF3047 family protein